ncbi:MAG: hypothetical protein C0392_16485 [Syntrophus sp. (in: bacteria)]|nr:hypothetical protein [Syntrophus sp. (in: bacteria)]
MSHDVQYQVEKVIPSLIGGTITGVFTDEAGEFFGFTVKLKGKTLRVWVDADEEGNKCGVLKIEGAK